MTFSDQEIINRFPVGYYPLHPNVSLNFQMNRFWGWVGDKQMLEELRAAGTRIASYDDWAREMFDLSDKALAAGRRLPAAYYAKMAIFFLDPSDPRVKPALQRFLDNVLAENGVTPEDHHLVPYKQTHLSAYRLTPAQPRGTIVVFGGYDSYILEWLPAALALRDAGLDAVIFDGPGQGAVLDAGTPMTPDWHLPAAAILEYFKLTDVTLMGFSLGGCLVIRAAAREPRISRVIAMDICTSLSEASTRGFGASGLSVIAANSGRIPAPVVNAAVAAAGKTDLLTDWVIAQGERVMGVATPADLFQAWREYRTDDVSPLVIQDVLLMAGAKDHYIPLQMLPDQLMTLTAARSVTARVFSEAESAQNHCQIGNMGLALKVIFDWLDETGGRTAESADRQ
ncbi:alpha/beta hydrolase [Roseiarcus sp.]|uniref:alpha/beta hydrolase n=1 Tax=Roseiarcus sp. TaxID=1969460 RepID=UPI003D11528E